MYVEYRSNNSGGVWWLNDDNWRALEAAGWEVRWVAEESGPMSGGKYARYMGALARAATRRGLSLQDAVSEWESIVGMSSTDAGCPCCGQPHTFYLYDDDDNLIEYGPTTIYGASW